MQQANLLIFYISYNKIVFFYKQYSYKLKEEEIKLLPKSRRQVLMGLASAFQFNFYTLPQKRPWNAVRNEKSSLGPEDDDRLSILASLGNDGSADCIETARRNMAVS